MKRTDITNFFPEATKEQIEGLLNIHSADIQRHKDDLASMQTQLSTAQEQLGQLTNSAEDLNAAISRAEKAEKELAALQGAEALRQIREKVAGEKNIPASLLTGETEEACAQQADAILAFANPGTYPHVPDGGDPTSPRDKISTAKQFAEWAKNNI